MTLGDLISNLTLFAQEGPAAPAEDPSFLQTLISNPLIPFVAIAVLFYLMMMRPERRKKAELRQKLANLKKNDRIVTIGGIYGTIVNVEQESKDITIRVDDNNNTRLRVLRSAVTPVVSAEDSADKDKG